MFRFPNRGRSIALGSALALMASLLATGILGSEISSAGAVQSPSGFVPASTATILEVPLPAGPTSRPIGITSGPDGNLWVAERDAHKIARITPAGAVTEFALDEEPDGIVAGSDGNLWFTEPVAPKFAPGRGIGRIGRITVDGTITEFNTPRQMGDPYAAAGLGITLGPDGNIWFLESNSRRLASITPDGVVNHEYVMTCCDIVDVTAGPDGNLWVFHNAGTVVQVTTDGVLTEFPLPDVARPVDATLGPDGNFWFTDYGTCDSAGVGDDYVWRLTPSGVATPFSLLHKLTCPTGITAGPDGNLWFTQRAGNLVGRMTTSGEETDVHIPTSRSGAAGIAAGPDGKVWFTEARAGQVARLDQSTITPPAAPCLVVTADTTLKSDVGPCPGDGIAVTGSNLTLNLNGHKVLGGGTRYGDFAGIHLMGTSGVTVVAGKPGAEVTGFDAGVWIDGGSANTVRNLAVHDNVSLDSSAFLGDGVLVLHSASNVIRDNTVSRNGIFDNLAITGVDSNGNVIQGNEVKEAVNAYPGTVPVDFFTLGTGVILNPFFEINNPRRGESISGNKIVSNFVHDNANSGITNLSNVHALISKNTIVHNGYGPPDGFGNSPYPGNGIGIQALFTATKDMYDTVDSNTVASNANDGIQVDSRQNDVRSNTVNGNAGSGVVVFSQNNRITANSADANATKVVDVFDLADWNQDCDANVWLNNQWGSGGFFPDCVTTSGRGPKAKAVSSSPSPPPNPTHSSTGATLFSRGKPVGPA